MDVRAAGPPGCSEGGVITSHAAFFMVVSSTRFVQSASYPHLWRILLTYNTNRGIYLNSLYI